MVLNKPYGLAVQGGSGTKRHIDGMLAALADKKGERPVLVHRLDRDTSGVLLIAKSRKIAAELGATFRSRGAKKSTGRWSKACPSPPRGAFRCSSPRAPGMGDERGAREGRAAPIIERMRVARHGDPDAQHSLTLYAVVDKVAPRLAWLSMRPITGRTHQLRAHCEAIGHPIIGDPKYNRRPDNDPARARSLARRPAGRRAEAPSAGAPAYSSPSARRRDRRLRAVARRTCGGVSTCSASMSPNAIRSRTRPMRDGAGTIDPMRAAQANMRPAASSASTRRASVGETEGGSSRCCSTDDARERPAEEIAVLPTRALAEALAAEWARTGRDDRPRRDADDAHRQFGARRRRGECRRRREPRSPDTRRPISCAIAPRRRKPGRGRGRRFDPVLDWAREALGARSASPGRRQSLSPRSR